MESPFTDFADDAVWRRQCEAREREGRDRYGDLLPVPPKPSLCHCLRCGAHVDASRHAGAMHWWEPGTETVHVCGLSPWRLRRKNDIRVHRMIEAERAAEAEWQLEGNEKPRTQQSLKIGGKRVGV